MVNARSTPVHRAIVVGAAAFGLCACFALEDLDSYPCALDGTCPPPKTAGLGAACVDHKCTRVPLDTASLIAFMAKFKCSGQRGCPSVTGMMDPVSCVANVCVLTRGCPSPTARMGAPRQQTSSGSSDGQFCSFACDSLTPCPGAMQCVKHVCQECTEDSQCGEGKCCGIESTSMSTYPSGCGGTVSGDGSNCRPLTTVISYDPDNVIGCYAPDNLRSAKCRSDIAAAQPKPPCDVVKQDCPSGKCTTVAVTPSAATNQCVPVTGTGGNGAPCTRTKLGADDCAKGFLCTSRPPGTTAAPLCLPLCNLDSDCDAPSGRACFSVGIPAAGACSPTCSPFEASCGPDTFCALGADPAAARLLPICSFVSPPSSERNRAEGAACDAVDQCQVAMGCESVPAGAARKCIRYCDTSHRCTSGTCTPIPSAGRGIGACL
jgi:hypothetical protein